MAPVETNPQRTQPWFTHGYSQPCIGMCNRQRLATPCTHTTNTRLRSVCSSTCRTGRCTPCPQGPSSGEPGLLRVSCRRWAASTGRRHAEGSASPSLTEVRAAPGTESSQCPGIRVQVQSLQLLRKVRQNLLSDFISLNCFHTAEEATTEYMNELNKCYYCDAYIPIPRPHGLTRHQENKQIRVAISTSMRDTNENRNRQPEPREQRKKESFHSSEFCLEIYQNNSYLFQIHVYTGSFI